MSSFIGCDRSTYLTCHVLTPPKKKKSQLNKLMAYVHLYLEEFIYHSWNLPHVVIVSPEGGSGSRWVARLEP